MYYDEGISGTKKENRTELLRMLSDCENKKIDLIITKSISRFARNTTDCLEMAVSYTHLDVYKRQEVRSGQLLYFSTAPMRAYPC